MHSQHDRLLTALVATAATVAGLAAAAIAAAAQAAPDGHPLATAAAIWTAPVGDGLAGSVAGGVFVWTVVFAMLFGPIAVYLLAREARRVAHQSGGYDARR